MKEDYKRTIAGLVSEAAGGSLDEKEAESLIEKPQHEFGDYAFPCFSLAKIMRKSPSEIAAEMSGKISGEMFSKVEANGAYVNFFIKNEFVTSKTLKQILERKDDYGKPDAGKGKRILVEYPSPNTNKPLHLGHVRNMLLGQSLSLILKFAGFEVFEVNLNNDRGVHICQAMLAYKKFGNSMEPDRKPDHFVGGYYVRYKKESDKSKELESELAYEAQEMLKKWEAGDEETLELWRKINSWALEGFRETYATFGIKHDRTYNESDHYREGKEIVMKAFDEKLPGIKKDDKGIYADLKEHGLPNKALLRLDGTSLYITQDINLARLKEEDFKMDRSVYVVGSEQTMHFKQLFRILKMLKVSKAEMYHLAHGMVYLPHGRMKSREGNVVEADNLVEEMEGLAYDETKKRHGGLSDQELKKRASQISMASLKFFILKYDPLKDFKFNSEKSLSFEGETGPYVQYTHARICSVFEKHEGGLPEDADFDVLDSPEEQVLIRLMSQFPQKVEEASARYKPLIICRYVLDLCQAFNNFYHQHSILQAEESKKDARLLLAECSRQVIKNALGLLSIEAPEKM